MNFSTKAVLCTIAALFSLSNITSATAEENDALAIKTAKISLTQAIAAAEQHAKGQAVKAELEQSKGKPVFEVEVVSGGKVFDVKVDANTGTVVSSTEDLDDAKKEMEEDEKEDDKDK